MNEIQDIRLEIGSLEITVGSHRSVLAPTCELLPKIQSISSNKRQVLGRRGLSVTQSRPIAVIRKPANGKARDIDSTEYPPSA